MFLFMEMDRAFSTLGLGDPDTQAVSLHAHRVPGSQLQLFHAQSFHWIDRGRFLRGDDTSKHGSESKREYTSKKEQRIPTTDLIQLGGNQAGTSNRT